jgi:Fe2+ transport system protein FeoA
MKNQHKTLDRICAGKSCIVFRIKDSELRSRSMVFGLREGKRITCQNVIPAGPVVIRMNRQELALGRELARAIEVEEIEDAPIS